MRNIGIIGEPKEAFIVQTLKNLYTACEKELPYIKSLLHYDKNIHNLDILIINGHGSLAAKYLPYLNSDGILIINSDDKNIYKFLKRVHVPFITYGFSSKSCVTASSVIDSEYRTIQFCIQRNLPKLSGEPIFEQEFSVNTASDHRDIYSILAAVSAALIDNMPIEQISRNNL